MKDHSDTEELLEQIGSGDSAASAKLLNRYRGKLRRMVQVRMDYRLQARVDPSDVVQDAMVTAHRRLAEFAKHRPMHFYAWLRQLTTDRLIDVHRCHLQADRRAATRDILGVSSARLAARLADSGLTPSGHLLHKELCDQVREALDHLPETSREVLLLRFVEQLSIRESADALGITQSALKSRQLRALRHLGRLIAMDTTRRDRDE